MKVGVTGQIGAGKSTAAKILERFGGFRIDADEIGRQVVEKHARLRRDLQKAFGSDIIDKKGKLKRQLVAERAFETWYTKDTLDRLVHPYLLRDLRKAIDKAERQHKVVIVDAALIFDWKLEKYLDLIIVIDATRKERLARLMKRGMKKSDILARQRRQQRAHIYRLGGDVVIKNRSTLDNLRDRLEYVWENRIEPYS